MVVGLLSFNMKNNAWNNFPLFNVHNGTRISFHQLAEIVSKYGKIYIESAESEGADYDQFDAPVLKKDQPKGSLDLIQELFGQKMINLNRDDTVIEAPLNNKYTLTAEEKNFEKFLFFQPKKEVLDHIIGNENKAGLNIKRDVQKEIEQCIGICEEAKVVERELSSLAWKVNYLVERDGKTPCISRKFIVREKKIILNLFHPEIRDFVELSCINPKLSAHWAIAMCLSDQKLFPHITPDAREDILLIDAMSRINDGQFIHEQTSASINDQFLDFLRNCKNKIGKG
ncbi:MAG: hypothetical protein HC906_11920 [Bacteroidales bacterium]|nr:hypothetical protein [Bacteroidales bacterium]